MRLHLVRHGETDINASGRLQGTTNSILNARGRAQARELAVASLTWNPVAVYSSPPQRARGVACAIADLSGLSVEELAEWLAEFDAPEPPEAELVHERTAGHPLAMELLEGRGLLDA